MRANGLPAMIAAALLAGCAPVEELPRTTSPELLDSLRKGTVDLACVSSACAHAWTARAELAATLTLQGRWAELAPWSPSPATAPTSPGISSAAQPTAWAARRRQRITTKPRAQNWAMNARATSRACAVPPTSPPRLTRRWRRPGPSVQRARRRASLAVDPGTNSQPDPFTTANVQATTLRPCRRMARSGSGREGR
jgi:hypothetical protein